MQLRVLSPTSEILNTDVTSVVFETCEGAIGVLDGHINLVSVLGIGVLRAGSNNQPLTVAIGGGLLEIESGVLTVFSKQADLDSKIVASELEKALLEAKDRLSSRKLSQDLIEIEKEIKYLELKKNLSRTLA